MDEKIMQHEEDINLMKSEFTVFRDSTNKKLDDIMLVLSKPMFTPFQILGICVILIGYMVTVMIYGGDIKSDVRVNTVEIQHYVELRKIQTLQYDKIQNTLDLIQIDVAVLKSEKDKK